MATRLIRLQCYEGLDVNAAIYEWNYRRQLLAIKAHEQDGLAADAIEARDLLRTFSAAPPAARGDLRRAAAGPADRRDRPRRRGVRGLSARDPVRLPDHDSRARHGPRDLDPACDPDQQPHARAVGRAAAALPLRLCRVPRRGARARDHPGARCRASRRRSPARSRASSRRCARRTWRRCRASPRRSTGRQPWSGSASNGSSAIRRSCRRA